MAEALSAPWLTIIGIGEDGEDGLSPLAKAALRQADVIYGGERHHVLTPSGMGERRVWPSPFSKSFEELEALRGRSVVVLASGDPMWFGAGSTLLSRFAREEVILLPGLSAFALAAARMGWPLQKVETISLHGRPLDTLRLFLYPGAKILALTSDGTTPNQIADILADEGYGASRLIVLENLGSPGERVIGGEAEQFNMQVGDLNTVAIEVLPIANTPLRPRTPGLPDEAFRHDGKLTKREVRSVTLSKLCVIPGQLLWDVGAGCGSVAIEWLRAAHNTKAIAIEPNDQRAMMMMANAASLGVPQLDLRQVTAPEGLSDLPDPDAIFIGGGLTAPGMVQTCHERLKSGGRLVANAVTLEGEAVLMASWQKYGGDLTRMAVSRIAPVGAFSGWKPMMQVTQWSMVKA
ncbi:precorrin-6y C5,15-methyltransferase (decarboxylating) subunit CbiE [Pseudovibrio exalbescens]|uniref:precorrin-6y C5,15-methyltransferase (decarboxylating) subunit CbiE n=1 Tax=Pseudovibrio exalbescens TaxID=197461 RepID=UPI0023666ABE|nr:precorrin-6y C5,15-methyltransferase (decarboxylating) subunit CbiE [Pseudovibrio exalbescens]MDD7909890.1 precorrin-6y C5,15-methyltransferase (decarboxylating) subunit CbiE [Pseudovibrio exalbescens]